MRLDRVLVYGSALQCQAAKARLFANRAICEANHQAKDGEETKNPCPAYLYPSDHYGILVDIPLGFDKSGDVHD